MRKTNTETESLPLERENLRSFVRMLQNEFSGLTIENIEDIACFSRGRLSGLLNAPDFKTIRSAEISALFRVYNDLKSGKKNYKPSRNIVPESVPLNKKRFQKFVRSLKVRYPYLSNRLFAELSGIPRNRIDCLLYRDDFENISFREIEAIGDMTYKLETGKFRPKKKFKAKRR